MAFFSDTGKVDQQSGTTMIVNLDGGGQAQFYERDVVGEGLKPPGGTATGNLAPGQCADFEPGESVHVEWNQITGRIKLTDVDVYR